MIPKKDQPTIPVDFRPISVISIIPKLISKVISNRLRTFLPDLISPNQTAFVQGRQISENFLTTRELLHHIDSSGNSVIFTKINFKKAFDTIEWPYLMRVMQSRGFPKWWLDWISSIWSTSTSRVCINREFSVLFKHKRGLRQGDPLSPMLFNIVVNVFQMIIHAVNSILSTPLTNKLSDSIIAL